MAFGCKSKPAVIDEAPPVVVDPAPSLPDIMLPPHIKKEVAPVQPVHYGMRGSVKSPTGLGHFGLKNLTPAQAEKYLAPILEHIEKIAPEKSVTLRSIYFRFDSSELSALAKEVLDKNIKDMGNDPEAVLHLEGNCDSRGTEDYNLELGHRRAEAVRAYLVERGSNGLVVQISNGERKPVCRDSSPVCYAMNRRVDFFVVTGGDL